VRGWGKRLEGRFERWFERRFERWFEKWLAGMTRLWRVRWWMMVRKQ